MLLHQQFVRSAKRLGDKPAIVDRCTNRRITYARALVASLILADRFKAYEPGFVGIMVPTSAGCSLAILGVLMSGRVPVMINFSTGAAANIEYARRKCDFTTVITSRALLQKISCPELPGMVFLEDIMASISPLEKVRAALTSKLPLRMLLRVIHGGTLDDDAVILFTSGSEKDPRAVPLSHRNITSNLEGIVQHFEFDESDVFLANLPFFHVFGLTTNFWVPMTIGMTMVCYCNPLEFRAVCDSIRDEKVTIVTGTPAFLWGYLRKSQKGDFDTVRYMIAGADKCPEALRKEFDRQHKVELLEGYGTTETSPVISANTLTHHRPGSVGKPLSNVQVRIEHYDTGEECATGAIGKILVKGDLVMRSYFDDFEETSLRLRHGWYDTGDMGLLDDDGYLWHVGRLRRFVKIGGEMVSLIKVENVLESLLPDGVECCVVEVPDHLKGARIVAVTTQSLDEGKVLKRLAAELPNIALPRQFVLMEELPKMGSGKIDFRTITERVRDMQPHR